MQRKFLTHLFTILSLVFLTSCDPDDKPIFNTEEVKLKAIIANTNEVLNLGDTLKLTLQLPDTVTSNSGTHPVKSLQECSFPMSISLVDTTNKKAVLQRPPVYWATQGSIGNNNFFIKYRQ